MTNDIFLQHGTGHSGQTMPQMFNNSNSSSSKQQTLNSLSNSISRSSSSIVSSDSVQELQPPFTQATSCNPGARLSKASSSVMPSSTRPIEHIQKAFDVPTNSLRASSGTPQKTLVIPSGIQNMFMHSNTSSSGNGGNLGGMDLHALLASGLGGGNDAQFAGTLMQIANIMQRKSQERDADMEALSQELDAAKALIQKQVSTMDLLGSNAFLVMELFEVSKKRIGTNQIRLDCLKKSMAMLQLVVKDQASTIEEADKTYKEILHMLAKTQQKNGDLNAEREKLLTQVDLAEEKVRNSLSSLEQQATSHTQHTKSLTAQIDHYTQEIQQVKEQLAQLKESHHDSEAKLRMDLEASHMTAENERTNFTIFRTQASAEVADLKGQLSSLQNECLELSKIAASRNETIKHLETEVAAALEAAENEKTNFITLRNESQEMAIDLESKLAASEAKYTKSSEMASVNAQAAVKLESDLHDLREASSKKDELLMEAERALELSRIERERLSYKIKSVWESAEQKSRVFEDQIAALNLEATDAKSKSSMEIEVWKQKFEGVTKQNEHIAEEASRYKTIVQSLQIRLDEATTSAQNLQTKYDNTTQNLQTEIYELKESFNSNLRLLEAEREELQNTLQQDREQLQRLKQDSTAEFQQLVQTHELKEQVLREEVQKLSLTRSNSTDHHIKALQDIEEKLAICQKALKEKAQRSTELEEEKAELIEQLSERAKHLAESDSQIATLKLQFSKELTGKDSQITSLKSEIEKQLVERSSQVSSLQAEVSSVLKKLADSDINVKALTLRISEIKEKESVSEGQISEFEKQREKLEDEKSKLIEEHRITNNDLQSRITQLQEAEGEAKKSIDELQERLQCVESDRAKAGADLVKLKTEMESDYKQKYDQAIGYRIAQHSAEMAKLGAKVEVINREKIQLVKEKDSMIKELENLKQQSKIEKELVDQANTGKETQISALEQQLNQITRDRDSFSQQNAELNERIFKLTAEISTLSLEIERLKSNTSQQKSSNISTTPIKEISSYPTLSPEIDHTNNRNEKEIRFNDIAKTISDDELSENEMMDDLIENLSQSISEKEEHQSIKRNGSRLPGPPIFNNINRFDAATESNLKRRRRSSEVMKEAVIPGVGQDNVDEEKASDLHRVKLRAIDIATSRNATQPGDGTNKGKEKAPSKIPTVQVRQNKGKPSNICAASRTSSAVRKKTRSQALAHETAPTRPSGLPPQVRKPISHADVVSQSKVSNVSKKHEGSNEVENDLGNIGALLNKTHQIAKSMNSYGRGSARGTNARVNVVSVTSNSVDMTTATFRGQGSHDGNEVDMFGKW